MHTLAPIPNALATSWTTTKPATSGSPAVPIPYKRSDPELVLGTEKAFFGLNSIHPADLINVIVTGGTGSGKSVSAVIPIMKALLRYKLIEVAQPGSFVVDPKKELLKEIRQDLSERGELQRLIIIGQSRPVQFFDHDCQLSLSDRLEKIFALVDPTDPNAHGAHQYWHEFGKITFFGLLQVVESYRNATKGGRLTEAWGIELGIPNISRNTWVGLETILRRIQAGGSAELRQCLDTLDHLCKDVGIHGASQSLRRFALESDQFTQLMYALQSAAPVIRPLIDPELAGYVDLDIFPDERIDTLNLREQVDLGNIIVFQPNNTLSNTLAAKAIKSKFFEAVFSRSNMEQPMVYVADEFQRFVTNDDESGEQALLDRARAYRLTCVLATQSRQSLLHALGNNALAVSAVDIIFANCPTKIMLRSTDTETTTWLRGIIPPPEISGPHILDVRPLVGLSPGEGYFLRADGAWGVGRVKLKHLL